MESNPNGTMSLGDYIEFCRKVIPMVSSSEITKRYKLAEKKFEQDKVPNDRLATISSYLILHNAYTKNWKSSVQISARYADFTYTKSGCTEDKDGILDE
jgi:hypothetical protein